jgi:hypothetical protein
LVVGAVIGGMIGYEIGRSLSEPDRKIVNHRFALGLSDGKPGQAHSWTNADRSAAVNYTPLDQTTKVNKTRIIHTSAIEPIDSMEMIGNYYKASKATRLSAAARPGGAVVGKVASGEQVYVLGVVTGKPWYVVGHGNTILGYAPVSTLAPVTNSDSSATLLTKAPDETPIATDAALASKEISVATPCRSMKYDIQTNGSKAEEGTFEGCKRLDGNWVLQPNPKSAG